VDKPLMAGPAVTSGTERAGPSAGHADLTRVRELIRE
jgi:hypothetical protein